MNEHGFPHGRHYAYTLRGAILAECRDEADRRTGRNKDDGYKDDYIHPKGTAHQHLLGCSAELALAAGTGLQWSGKGQGGRRRADVGEGVFPLEAKATGNSSRGLVLAKHDLNNREQRPYVLFQVDMFPDQICCYPVGWVWRSTITGGGVARADLRDFAELLDQLEGRGHGPYDEAVGTPEEVSRRQ